MKKVCDFLSASGTMVDTKLEPTDATKYLVTIKNTSDLYTANNVMATIGLVGGPADGVEITPDDRSFGNIGPKDCVTREISIVTERADVRKYKLCYHLNFTAAYEKCEGEETEFVVDPD